MAMRAPRTFGAAVAFIGVLTFGARDAGALPIVIDFEGVAPLGGLTGARVTPYQEDGFTLNNPEPGSHIDDIFNNVTGFNANGNVTSIFVWCDASAAGCGLTQVALLNLSRPTPFSLVSIDFGGYADGGDPQFIDVTGFFWGGGTILSTIDPLSNFTTFTFPGFTNLASVQINHQFLNNTDYAALDNIVVEDVTAVPEPASLLLLGSGVAGIVGRRWRRGVR